MLKTMDDFLSIDDVQTSAKLQGNQNKHLIDGKRTETMKYDCCPFLCDDLQGARRIKTIEDTHLCEGHDIGRLMVIVI